MPYNTLTKDSMASIQSSILSAVYTSLTNGQTDKIAVAMRRTVKSS